MNANSHFLRRDPGGNFLRFSALTEKRTSKNLRMFCCENKEGPGDW